MTFNNKIRIQRKITRRIEFFLILNNIWENTKSYNKKENKKRNIVSHRNKIDIKREHTRKLYTRILKEIISIFKC